MQYMAKERERRRLAAEAALDFAEASILTALKDPRTSRNALHVIVGERFKNGASRLILARRSFGADPSTWEHPYDTASLKKFELSAREGLDTRVIRLERPDLIREDDTWYWGSIVRGIAVIAASGVQSYFDEAFAEMVAAFYRAFLQLSLEEIRQLSK